MKRRASFLAFVAAALLSVSAFAQRTVSGTVTDAASGEGLPSVSVRVKGTNNAAVSNYDGKYTITAGQNAVLVFSALGYATQEVAASGAVVNVKLAESTSKHRTELGCKFNPFHSTFRRVRGTNEPQPHT